MLKKILIGLLVILVVIQFIRPAKNVENAVNENDITLHYTVPGNVQQILKKACRDCHSNNTEYPWYANIQPIGFWLQNHIKEGKGELNFSEFNTYSAKKKAHKMEEVAEIVGKGEMPLGSYTIIHRDARLTPEESHMLVEWANALHQQILLQQ